MTRRSRRDAVRLAAVVPASAVLTEVANARGPELAAAAGVNIDLNVAALLVALGTFVTGVVAYLRLEERPPRSFKRWGKRSPSADSRPPSRPPGPRSTDAVPASTPAARPPRGLARGARRRARARAPRRRRRAPADAAAAAGRRLAVRRRATLRAGNPAPFQGGPMPTPTPPATVDVAVKPRVAFGTSSTAGAGVTVAAYVAAVIALVDGARDEATLTLVVVGTVALVTTLAGRFAQAVAAIKRAPAVRELDVAPVVDNAEVGLDASRELEELWRRVGEALAPRPGARLRRHRRALPPGRLRRHRRALPPGRRWPRPRRRGPRRRPAHRPARMTRRDAWRRARARLRRRPRSARALRRFLKAKARLGWWDPRMCAYYGVSPNVNRGCRRGSCAATSPASSRRRRSACPSTPFGTYHGRRNLVGQGQGVDLGLRRELVGTAKGTARMAGFQRAELARRRAGRSTPSSSSGRTTSPSSSAAARPTSARATRSSNSTTTTSMRPTSDEGHAHHRRRRPGARPRPPA